jgi:opacity protein-like surface antigen
MKKLLLLLLVIVSTSASAQFYAGINAGYALGTAKRANGKKLDGKGGEAIIYGSYGEGFSTNLKFGYMFSEFIGIEMGVSYIIGADQSKLETPTSLVNSSSTGIRLSPQLVLKTNKGLYSRVGIIVPVAGKTDMDFYDVKVNAGNLELSLDAKQEFRGVFSVGVIGAIGYSYALNDKFDLFAEVEYIGLAIKSGTVEFMEYELSAPDGTVIRRLEDLTEFERYIEFVDEIDPIDNPDSPAYNPDPNKPNKALRQEAPFSSIGFNIGIVMKF